MIPKTTIISILLFFALESFAQTYLVVDTYRGKKRIEYHVGDEIAFKLMNDEESYYGIIQSMKKGAVFISNVLVPLDEISMVYTNQTPENNSKINQAVSATSKAAWIIPAIALLNPVIIDGSDPINAKNVVISSLALASPFYINSRKNKKAKINKRYRIRMVSFDDLLIAPSRTYNTD